MSEVTRLIECLEEGDPKAAERLLPLVYAELRRLAAVRLAKENPGQTLQATALVHEAYVRLMGSPAPQEWNSRGHFFGAAAEAMRRVLIDRARDKRRLKRGGGRRRLPLNLAMLAQHTAPDDLLSLDDALEALRLEYSDTAELVKLRFFGGLSLKEAAASLGISTRTANRHWAFARAWLHRQLRGEGSQINHP